MGKLLRRADLLLLDWSTSPLFVDSMETRSGVPQLLSMKLPIRTSRLWAGDYAWVSNWSYDPSAAARLIGVERKACPDDFNGSMAGKLSDSRIVSQLRRMEEMYDVRLLLLEGDLKQDNRGKLAGTQRSWASVMGFLNRVVLEGFGVIRTTGPEATAARILELVVLSQRVSKLWRR